MLHYVHGDMFSRPYTARVNPVNCVGVMGKGLALVFAKRYPRMLDEYRTMCRYGGMRIGFVHMTHGFDCIIYNVPTKRDWRDLSTLADVEASLHGLRLYLDDLGPQDTVALPPLGCGLGGLCWIDVKPLVEKILGDLDLHIDVYVPLRYMGTKQA